MDKQTGGAAFPSPDFSGSWEGPYANHGMSLRDHFAAQALAGLLAQAVRYSPPSVFAREAYAIADAMIAERAK